MSLDIHPNVQSRAAPVLEFPERSLDQQVSADEKVAKVAKSAWEDHYLVTPAKLKAKVEKFVHKDVMFRNVPNKQETIQHLHRVIDSEGFEGKLTDLCLLANGQMDLENPIFNDPDMAYFVMIAYMTGNITDTQTTTLNFFKDIVESYQTPEVQRLLTVQGKKLPGYELIPLFIKGRINPEAERLLKETVPDAGERRQYFNEMRKMPASEQYLFHLQRFSSGLEFMEKEASEGLGKNDYALETARLNLTSLAQQPNIVDVIHMSGATRFTYVGNKKEGRTQIVPSAGMMEAMIKVRGGEKCWVYILGSNENSPWETVTDKQGKEVNLRAVSMPCKGIPLPKSADQYPTPFSWLFTFHDLVYHMYLVSQIPTAHRDMNFAFINALKEASVEVFQKRGGSKREIEQVNMFISQMVDMEVRNFRQVKGFIKKAGMELPVGIEDATFWFNLNNNLLLTNARLRAQAARNFWGRNGKERSNIIVGDKEVQKYPTDDIQPLLLQTISRAIEKVFTENRRVAERARVSVEGLRAVGEAYADSVKKNDPLHPITRIWIATGKKMGLLNY